MIVPNNNFILCDQIPYSKQPHDGKQRRTYKVEFHYESNLKIIQRTLSEAKAFYLITIIVPYWNTHGQVISQQYITLYQHYEELGFEVLT